MEKIMKRDNLALRIAGVLMIPTGLVRIVFGIYMLYFLAMTFGYGARSVSQLHAAMLTLPMLIAGGACESGFGLWGVIPWNELLPASRSLLFAVLTLALCLLDNVLQYCIGYGNSYVAWITGVIVPVPFVLAAAWLRYAHRKR